MENFISGVLNSVMVIFLLVAILIIIESAYNPMMILKLRDFLIKNGFIKIDRKAMPTYCVADSTSNKDRKLRVKPAVLPDNDARYNDIIKNIKEEKKRIILSKIEDLKTELKELEKVD